MIALHQHSDFSNAPYLDAINRVKDLIKINFDLGLTGAAITDHELLSGHVRFLDEVMALRKKGESILKDNPNDVNALRAANFIPILGNEIYIAKEGQSQETHVQGDKFYHLILLAKNKRGWEQLNELSTRAWSRYYKRAIPRRPTYLSDLADIFGKEPGNVIVTTACLGSYLGFNFISMKDKKIEVEEAMGKIHGFIDFMKGIFGDDFYLEVQPGQSKEQKDYNVFLENLSKEHDVRLVVTCDAHYQRPERKKIHEAYLNSQDAEGRETGHFYDYTYMMSEKEVFDFLTTHLSAKTAQAAINETKKIGNKIEIYSIKQTPIIPRVPYHDESKWEEVIHEFDEYEFFSKFSNSKYEEDKFFMYQMINGLKSFVEKGWANYETALPRIDEELEHIWGISEVLNQRMSTYFTTFQAMINEIWKKSVVGPGRGSAGAFFINYILEITQIDPLEYDFPSWRFLHKDKVSLPDIDIDYATSLRSAVTSHLQSWFESFGSILTGIATWGTEKPKSALITAARGLSEELGYTPEDGLYFASLVPSERGFLWPLKDCYYGEEEKGRRPISEFVEAMNSNPKVWEIAQEIEGLINEMGSHPSGIAIFESNKIYSQCGLAKSPGGLAITQFDLEDAEKVGVTKYDLLSTDAIDAQQTEIYLLAEQGFIEWKGSLKITYNSILHPKVLDYKTKEMWEKSHRKEIISWFQFDTPVGEVAIESIKPTDLEELAILNSVMRLMSADGGEMPLVQYKHRKENIQIWYSEMRYAGLNEDEIKVLEKHLSSSYGMCITQEQLMIMLQDPKIANFTYMQSDYARKVVAKKKMKEIEALKNKIYEEGLKAGNSQRLLDYVWFNSFAIQMGYSFSIIHTVSYSIIAVQQLNLLYYYPSIFWATSRLIVESKSVEFLDEDLELLASDDEEDEEEEKKKAKGVNYFKMSSALNKIKAHGIKIQPPDINTSTFTFHPNVEKDKIFFGLKGITRISNSTIEDIISNRPYVSLEDFLSKVKVNAIQVTMLIKAGAFDDFGERGALVVDYARGRTVRKGKITLQNFNALVERGLIPQEYDLQQKIFRLTKHIKKYFVYGDKIVLDTRFAEMAEQVGFTHLQYDEENGYYVDLKTWETFYKTRMEKVKPWMKKNEELLIDSLFNLEVKDIVDKYWNGNPSYGEMEAISFYHSKHEFDYPEYAGWLEKLGVVNFFDLEEEPILEHDVYKIFRLSQIAGVCIGRDKAKKVVGLMTREGFIKVKVHRAQFIKYDKQIKIDGETEKSWFGKGSKLLIVGYRNGDYFHPKIYKNSKFKQALYKINEPGMIQRKRLGEE